MNDRIATIATQLCTAGLYSAALHYLSDGPGKGRGGSALNRLRRECQRRGGTVAPPGLYLLLVDDVGIPLPLRARMGTWFANLSISAVAAWNDGCRAARRLFGDQRDKLPTAVASFPLDLGIDGSSIGLAAALAAVSLWSDIPLLQPVFASGAVAGDGRILPVDHLDEKLGCLRLFPGDGAGVVLIPKAQEEAARGMANAVGVSTVEEAAAIVFKRTIFSASHHLVAVSDILGQAIRSADHQHHLTRLLQYPMDRLTRFEEALMHVGIGTKYRHLGDPAQAAVHHNKARSMLAEVREQQGSAVWEELLAEILATDLSHYQFDGMEEALRERVAVRPDKQHNLVRFKGMLAQLLATLGRNREAVALRDENLLLQQEGNLAMQEEIPRTLAYAVHESARAGDGSAFDRYRDLLCRHTRDDDGVQWRYNSAAVLRGLVLLGRMDDAWTWLEKGTDAGATHARSLLQGSGPVSAHPETTIARCMARVLRHNGRIEQALSLLHRIAVDDLPPMARWFARLGVAEQAMCLPDKSPDRARLLVALSNHLKTDNQNLSSFHHHLIALLSTGKTDHPTLEHALDEVYY